MCPNSDVVERSENDIKCTSFNFISEMFHQYYTFEGGMISIMKGVQKCGWIVFWEACNNECSKKMIYYSSDVNYW